MYVHVPLSSCNDGARSMGREKRQLKGGVQNPGKDVGKVGKRKESKSEQKENTRTRKEIGRKKNIFRFSLLMSCPRIVTQRRQRLLFLSRSDV